ncbi:hypothetical protein ONZ45_g18762 [Pleurotus djamor]|nr:hypothetical protein ONZ45_g18762 [Pleurotus djamor]
MGVKTIIQAAVAAPYAWQTYRRWRSRSNEDRDRDDAERYQSHASYDPDLSPRRPLLMQSTSPIEVGPYSTSYTYGATAPTQDADDLPGYGGGAIHSSPERMRRNSTSLLHGVPEAEENEQDDDELPSIEEELEEEGLYKGSYSHLLFLYTLVPVTALLAWIALAVLPTAAYSSRHPSTIYPYLPYFPFPLPELLTTSALWCLAYVLRAPIFTFLTYLFANPPLSWLPTLISTFLHSFTTIVLCVASFVVLQIPHATHTAHTTYRDPAFLRVWFLALGWALAEGFVAVAQGYAALASYKDVLIAIKDDEEDVEASSVTQSNGSNNGKAPQRENHSPEVVRSSTSSSPLSSERRTLLNKDLQLQRRASNMSEEEILQMELDHDFDQLMAVKMRDDLEDLYGIPYIKIPVFLTSLQRINSVLLTLGVFLLSSSAYLRSPLSVPTLSSSPISSPTHDAGYTTQWNATKSNKSLYITIPLLLFVHTALGLLHTPLILPKLGVHTVVYAGLLVSLASFCAGLGVWEALS